MGRFLPSLLILVMLISLPFFSPVSAQEKVNIGIIVDGPWERGTSIGELFTKEISDLLAGEFEVEFIKCDAVETDWSVESIKNEINNFLNDPNIDIVITMGVSSSHLAAHMRDLPKPVIAPFILDAVIQDLPYTEEGTSGVKNLTYISVPNIFKRDVQAFTDIFSFKKLGILLSENMVGISDNAVQKMHTFVPQGVESIDIIPVAHSAEKALADIPPDVEAVFLAPLFMLDEDEFRKLADGLIEKKLPSFSLLGRMDVEVGILAGLTTERTFDRWARRVALNVQRILLGDRPEDIPVAYSMDQQLSINMETCRKVGIYPKWKIMTEAELVNAQRKEVSKNWNLGSAVNEAVRVNIALAAQRMALEASEKDIQDAWSNYLPQADVYAQGALIDEDRAEASLGQAAERTITGGATVTQLVFSEPALANISIQRNLQRSREEEFESLRLDIGLEAAIAYLDVLRAKTIEEIQKENLLLSRSNLELARVRESVGVAGPAEVYRWEASIAQDRQSVIQANSRRNLAEIQFNRILHRPLEEHFTLEKTDLVNSNLLVSQRGMYTFIEDPLKFRTLREFLVIEGLSNAPELAMLDKLIEVKKRSLASNKHSFYAPTIALQANLENVFDRQGAGSDPGAMGDIFGPLYGGLNEVRGAAMLPPIVPGQMEEADDLNWSVGVNISLPVFNGGSRIIATQKTSLEVKQLEQQRASVAEQVEQRIRSSAHMAGASYASIELSRSAAEAARKTYETVRDGYARGAVSIIELLDAQNATLVTDQIAANAVYDFLVDYMNVQRAVGELEFFVTQDAVDGMIQRLSEYFISTQGK